MASHTPFHVTITNVAGALYEGSAGSLSVPGAEGDMVVLAHHEPIVALLRGGTITLLTETGDVKQFPITSGVLEVSHNSAIVLL
jgi:F-type H+-transporting ATPase subunit epsilon